ncbi:MAG: RNA polymerase subunit sigma-70 [Flavobacteriaceae bacterium]|nr:RNA polymerase subunit sigma-70 [Flavobacteriaceae bacterium]
MTEELVLVEELQNPATRDRAFKELVRQYKERLYWHIRKIVLVHDDADDVLQNTFVKIFKNIQNFKQDSKLFSWMYRIATNEAISFINKRAKQNNVTIEEYHQQSASKLQSDVFFNGNQIQLILQKAIATLPQKQQLVFNMRYFEELKYEEISEILGTSVGALKASYHHASKKIQEYIKTQTH